MLLSEVLIARNEAQNRNIFLRQDVLRVSKLKIVYSKRRMQ